jgi:ABC-2 type transport system permease protein
LKVLGETRALLGGCRLEAILLARAPGQLTFLISSPLLAVILLSLARLSTSESDTTRAILAPGLIALWGMALGRCGELIIEAKRDATLELLLAAPVNVGRVLVARIAVVTTASLLGFLESALVAKLLFGERVGVAHVGVFVCALGLTVVGTCALAYLLSVLFVFSRSARQYQNSLSYPIYLVSGIAVPLSLLPGWLRPLSWLSYLSWGVNLLVDASGPAPVESASGRLLAMLALVALLSVASALSMRRAVAASRRTGSIGRV